MVAAIDPARDRSLAEAPGTSGGGITSWHGVNVELNIREATALEGHSREAIHLAAEVIADVTGYSRVELATLISESIGGATARRWRTWPGI